MAPYIITVFLFCSICATYGAVIYNRDSIQKISGDVKRIRKTANIVKRSTSTSTFVTEADGRDLQTHGYRTLLCTLEIYKGVFLDTVPSVVSSQQFKDIFDLTPTKWTLERKVVAKTIPAISGAPNFINVSSSREVFFRNIVTLYKTSAIYTELNAVINGHKTHVETNFGPYALMLNTVLSHWTTLPAYDGKTYRGVSFNKNQIAQYTTNTIFAWRSFTSSSSSKAVACQSATTALFVIDNSVESPWRPRNVTRYSVTPDELEHLYPLTAMFKVTDVKTGGCGKSDITEIHISLDIEEKEPSKATSVSRSSRGGFAFSACFAVFIGFLIA